MLRRLIASLVCLTFSFTNLQYVHAQDFSINQLPVPGTMIGESAPFAPLALKGLIVNSQKPLEFQFIVDTGRGPQDTASIKEQANQLVKYFLAGLTIPEGDLWVNLSPYEKNRMVPEALGQTDLGRDLLAQDYILKQLTASLIYPEKDLGKEFWSRVYAKAQQQFGTTNVPVNTFNKVWILPDQAQVFENVNAAYVTKSTLKVMLDEDYLAKQKHQETKAASISSQIVREIVIPEITKEVNTGKNFAPLRQIYQALILAKWYKETIQNGLLDALYTNKNKVAGVNLSDPAVKEQIYERYLNAYKKGAFNYIKEDPTPDGQVVPRKYFSGGEVMVINLDKRGRQADVKGPDGAMISVVVGLAAAGAAIVGGYVLYRRVKTVKERSNDSRIVLAGLFLGVDANARDEDGYTVLMLASAKGYIDVVELLLAKGAKVNAKMNNGATALMMASQEGHKDVVELLLAAGADVIAEANDGVSALMLASAKGYIDVVELLLAKGAKVNAKMNNGATALMMASQEGHKDVVELLLAAGADVIAEANDGVSALFMAAQEGRKDIVEILLAKGANVNVKRNDGVTALMSASREGHKDVVEQLLAQGADVIAKANDGGTALMMAAQNGHKEAVKLLLAKGADVNAKTDTSSTALILASQEGHKDVVELLLAAGADVNAKANTGATALMLAARGGYTEIVKLFIDRQINLNLQASNGVTALSLARLHGHQDIVDILIAHGAKDNAMLQTPKQGPQDVAMTNEDNLEARLEESTSPESSEKRPTDDDLLKTYNTVLGLLTKRRDPQNAAYFMTDGEAGMFTRFRADVAPFLENQDDKGFALKRWWMQRGRRGGEGPSYGVVAAIVASPYVRQKNFKNGPGNYALTDLPAIGRRIITRAVEGEGHYGTVGKDLQGSFFSMLQHINIIPEGQVAISQDWVAQVKAEIKRLNNQKNRNRRQKILVMMSEEEVDEAVRLLNPFIAKEKVRLAKRDERLKSMRSQKGVQQDLQENLKIRSRQFFEFLRDRIGLTDLAHWSDYIVVRRPINTRRETTLQRRTALQSMAEVFALLDDGYVIEKISSSGRLIDLGPDVHSIPKQDIFSKMETVQNNPLISNLSRYVSERPFDIYFNFDLYGQQVKKAQHQQMDRSDIILLINYVKTAVSNGKNKIEISDKDFDWKITPTTRNMVIEALNLFELPKKKLIVPSPGRTETSRSWRLDIGVEDTAMLGLNWILNHDEAMTNGGIDLNQINVLRNGKTVNVKFDPAQLRALEQGGFEGFTPVIIDITPISSPFQLLGINPLKQEVLVKA